MATVHHFPWDGKVFLNTLIQKRVELMYKLHAPAIPAYKIMPSMSTGASEVPHHMFLSKNHGKNDAIAHSDGFYGHAMARWKAMVMLDATIPISHM